MAEFSYEKVDAARKAYEAAIREFHETRKTSEVQFLARKLCSMDHRTSISGDTIVTALQGCEMLRVGQGEYAMLEWYVPHWVIYAGQAEVVLDGMKELNDDGNA